MMENKANYPEMFFLFFAGSVLGFLLEGIWRVIRTGAWENHAATVWGPFCIIYGFGAAALYWISGQASDLPIWAQFLLYALIGAAVEYLEELDSRAGEDMISRMRERGEAQRALSRGDGSDPVPGLSTGYLI